MEQIELNLTIKTGDTEVKVTKTTDFNVPIQAFPKDLADKITQFLNLLIVTSNQFQGKTLSFPFITAQDTLIIDTSKFNITASDGGIQQSFNCNGANYVMIHQNHLQNLTIRNRHHVELPQIDYPI